jgi:hypothetical protein
LEKAKKAQAAYDFSNISVVSSININGTIVVLGDTLGKRATDC